MSAPRQQQTRTAAKGPSATASATPKAAQPPVAAPPAAAAKRPQNFAEQLEVMLRPEIERALPPGVDAERFMRIVITAIVQNPDLERADRRSLFTSCVKCAQDGLVPDGREAALVIYNTKEKFGGREQWVKKVQYMPMVFGIIKKVRNSGELISLTSNVVFEDDQFRYWIDDSGEHVTHEPHIPESGAKNRGKVRAVYAIAKLKNGGSTVEVLTHSQIQQVRQVSKAKDNGPWVDWFDEMARKSAIRRLSKRLPMSSDLATVIRRDDEMYDFQRPRTASARSGVDAAKTLLGISPMDDEPGGDDQAGGDAGEQASGDAGGDRQGDEYKAHFADDNAAIDQLKKTNDVAQLDTVWDHVKADFQKTNREISNPVHAAYTDHKAALEQAHSKQGRLVD